MRTILISAYGCEPLKGSEQGVGWNWILQMAKNNILHVITRANNQSAIESHLPDNLSENITFHYYDTNSFISSFKNKAKGLYFYYFCWQVGIVPLIRRLMQEHRFDYSMHLTFGSMWMPTLLPFFKVPFIWGPIGGGDGIPRSFLCSLPAKQRFIQWLRYLLKYPNFINPFFIFTVYRAIAIIARTNITRDYIPSFFRKKVNVLLETSIESEIFDYHHQFDNNNNCIKLIITGRLVPFKNVITAIRSIGHLPVKYDVSLTIIGSGPDKEKIEKEIKINNLSDRVKMIPEMPRAGVLNELAKSDIYLCPSLREGGSWALMEAMAVGLPVICLKWSGMEIITDDESAIRLPVTNPVQFPKDMAAAICKLIDNPALRQRMGAAGRERIRSLFNWSAKGEFIENLFDELDKKCQKQKYLKY